MQCCKPAIRQGELLNDPPRHMPFCILGRGSTQPYFALFFCQPFAVRFKGPALHSNEICNQSTFYIPLHIEKFNISSRVKFAQNKDCVS